MRSKYLTQFYIPKSIIKKKLQSDERKNLHKNRYQDKRKQKPHANIPKAYMKRTNSNSHAMTRKLIEEIHKITSGTPIQLNKALNIKKAKTYYWQL